METVATCWVCGTKRDGYEETLIPYSGCACENCGGRGQMVHSDCAENLHRVVEQMALEELN